MASPPKTTLHDVEREHIRRTLSDCDGNISRTARELGINRRTLQRKLKAGKKVNDERKTHGRL